MLEKSARKKIFQVSKVVSYKILLGHYLYDSSRRKVLSRLELLHHVAACVLTFKFKTVSSSRTK